MAAITPLGRDRFSDGPAVVTAGERMQEILGVLDDATCRSILEATGDEARSASELSEACDLALSTTYRKLNALVDAGLLREGTRIRHSGSHTSEYSRCIDDVVITVGADEGIELTISGPNSGQPA